MRILALETSAPTGSVAVWSGGRLDEEVGFSALRNHAAELAPRVRALAERHGGLTAFEGYAISIGPGSFTGLRIGVSFLKGLAAVVPRPSVGVSSLRVMAAQSAATAGACGVHLAVLDARRGEAFAGLYGPDSAPDPRLPDGLYSVAALEGQLRRLELHGAWVGDAVLRVEGLEPAGEKVAIPCAATVARLGAQALEAGEGIDAADLDPAYLQRSGAELTLGISADAAPLNLTE